MDQEATDREQLLEEELLLIRHSGELPEVALQSSLYALSEDADGPGLQLTAQELRHLHEATWAQYQRILLRDLQPANRGRSIFRGLQRAIFNWQRLGNFGLKMDPPRQPDPVPVAQALLNYLQVEVADQQAGKASSINCSTEDLLSFTKELRCFDQVFLVCPGSFEDMKGRQLP